MNLLISQWVPPKPALQFVQVYWFTSSLQVPPFWQGFEEHSSVSNVT